jgi:hypothetical protein
MDEVHEELQQRSATYVQNVVVLIKKGISPPEDMDDLVRQVNEDIPGADLIWHYGASEEVVFKCVEGSREAVKTLLDTYFR